MSTSVSDLPQVEGRYTPNALLADQTWFRVGGPAEVLYRPKTVDDLQLFLQQKPKDIPLTIIGAGSNILVRDSGIEGVVIRLAGRGFAEITVHDLEVTVGAGCLDRTLALTCADHDLGGLEFLVGIPGTIGGAVRMNAGAYDGEVKDFLLWAEALDESGNLHRLTPTDLGFTYRHSMLPEKWIVTRACFKTFAKPSAEVHTKLQTYLQAREDTQPVKGRTGGSTFKNPEGFKAWELIDKAGCRGLQRGGAQVSEKHCNFLLNTGDASAADLETLGEDVRQRVLNTSGVQLEWEIVRLGL